MKVSVITICRNDLEGLKQTFESVRAQDHQDVEWCVIDGKSHDGTVEWLKENHKLNGKWISERDDGIYDAMNKGVRLASGEYVLFMNSGDRFAAANVVSRLVRRIGSEEGVVDFIYGDSLDVDGDGTCHYRKAMPISLLKFGMPTRHQAMMYRKAALSPEGYPLKYKLSGDYALTALIVKKKRGKALKVGFPVCLFVMGGAHDYHRIRALREDYAIRKNIMNENAAICGILFLVHLVHHLLRIGFPRLNAKIIYRSNLHS